MQRRIVARRYTAAIILAAYAIHSLASLSHEVVWIKLMAATFGMSLAALSIIIAVFMSGIALGSLAVAHLQRRFAGTPIAWFCFLEVGLGLWAILLPGLVRLLDRLYTAQALPDESAMHTLLRLVGVASLILVPSGLIGAVFPVLSQLAPQFSRNQTQGPGTLYFIGLLFSAIGSVIAPAWLIPQLGISGSCAVAGAINLTLAAVMFIVRRTPWTEARELPVPVEREVAGPKVASLHGVAFVQGFALFALEMIAAKVVWLVVDSTAYAEGILFGVVLGAMALGGLVLLVLRRFDVSVVRLVGFSLLLIALAQGVMIPTADRLASAFLTIVHRHAWITASTAGFCTAQAVFVLVALGPAVVFGAMAFTGLCELAVRGETGFTVPIARLYAWNNAGAVVGSLVTGLTLVPTLGLTLSLSTVSVLLIGTAIFFVARTETSTRVRTTSYCLSLMIAVPVIFWGISGDITYRTTAAGNLHSILFHHEDGFGVVEVLENRRNGSRVLKSSRLRQEGGTLAPHIRMQKMQGQLPMLLHAAPERILVVGMGTGISLSGFVWDGLSELSCVEVSRGVIQAEPFFRPFNDDVVHHERVRLFNQDGRDFVKLTRERYDLIVQDVFFPYQSGVTNLYSVEHFRRCRDRLAPGGVMAQWICLNQVSTQDLQTLVRTFGSVFPHTTLWRDEIYLLLWATPEALSLDLEEFVERVETRRPAGRTEPWPEPEELLTRFVCDERSVNDWTSGAALNTDDNARIEFQTPLHFAELNSPTLAARNLKEVQALQQPIASVCAAPDPADQGRLSRLAESAALYLSGTIALLENDTERARRDIRASYDANPHNMAALDWVIEDIVARAYHRMRDSDPARAVAILDEGPATAAHDPRIFMARTRVLTTAGRIEEAMSRLQSLLDENPRLTVARLGLGALQFQQGHWEDAAATFRRGLEITPDDPDLEAGLKRCLDQLGGAGWPSRQRASGTDTEFRLPASSDR